MEAFLRKYSEGIHRHLAVKPTQNIHMHAVAILHRVRVGTGQRYSGAGA